MEVIDTNDLTQLFLKAAVVQTQNEFNDHIACIYPINRYIMSVILDCGDDPLASHTVIDPSNNITPKVSFESF